MALRQLIHRLFPVLMMAGLVLSPFSASSAVNVMGSEAMRAMADDMPDCPSGQPAMPDCLKTCPLMTACAANWVAGAAHLATSILDFGQAADTMRPANDAFGVPLAEGPPARPPRT